MTPPRAHLTSALVPAEETTRGEVWKVVVTPSDGTLDGTPAEASVIIGNSLPSTTLAVDPPIPTAADAMIATATTSDEDDDPVTVAWSWSRNGVLFGVTTNELPVGTLTRGDVWEVTATPADDAAAGSPATVGFTVENARSTLQTVILGPAGATVADAVTVSFSGASDPDGDAVDVRVAWMVDGIEVFTEVVGGEESATLSGLYGKGAEVVVIATPTDGYDDGAPVTSEVLVIADSPPSATGAHIAPDPVYVDSVVTCVGEGWADADGDDEGWRTTWTVDGAVVAAGAVLPAGTYTRGSVLGCELVPYDGELEGPGVTAADVTVQNSAPACATTGITIGPDPATRDFVHPRGGQCAARLDRGAHGSLERRPRDRRNGHKQPDHRGERAAHRHGAQPRADADHRGRHRLGAGCGDRSRGGRGHARLRLDRRRGLCGRGGDACG